MHKAYDQHQLVEKVNIFIRKYLPFSQVDVDHMLSMYLFMNASH